VRRSDEFQQRMHLLALGAATTLVAGLSLAGGFLAAAGVFRVDGEVLVWVFPSLVVSYSAARVWLTHHYGGGSE
jgi:hypothetical protein